VAALVLLGASIRFAVVPGASVFTAIMTAALCSSASLALFGYAGALVLGDGVSHALGLGAGRLSGRSVAAVLAGTLGLSQLLDVLLRHTGLHAGSALQSVEQLAAEAGSLELGLAFLALAVAPALGEALFFRGLLLRGLAKRGGAFSALFISSLLFGALHFDLAQGLAAVVLGVYLGSIALVSGSTRTPMLCHGVNNAVALATARWGLGGEVGAWVMALCGAALCLGSWVLVRGFASRCKGPTAARN